MKNTSLLLLTGFVFLLSAPLMLTGSVVVLMDLDELVAGSDSIVEAEVESVQSRWENRQIFTHITIRIVDPMKGDRSRTLVIRQLGGRVGALNAVVAGMPQFEPGAHVIVFLKDSGNGTFQVVGMNQGRYVITEDYAISNISGVDLMNPETGIVIGASKATRVGVEELKTRIRELAR